MWSSLFIIDPAYTLPLLVAFVGVLMAGARPLSRHLLVAGLALSSAYIGWSLLAKSWVDRDAQAALAVQGLGDAPRLSTPMPFSTLLWRVVVLTPEGMLEGYRSLAVDRAPMRFTAYAGEMAAWKLLSETPSVVRLLWFSSGFLLPEAEGNDLVLSDLRMGAAPFYSFRYRVAERGGAQAPWTLVPPTAVPSDDGARRIGVRGTWHRLWHEPAPDQPPFSFTAFARSLPPPSP